MIRQRLLGLGLIGSLVTSLGLLAPAQQASAAPVTGFDPGMIISDQRFYDSNAMTASQVQSFLNARVPRCEPERDKNPADITCLKDYVTTTVAKSANSLCKGYTAKTQTAAQIIDGVARSCGVSQKVLLVTLQKEQGLVTNTFPSSSRYLKAMGFGCPDTAPCDEQYYGFFNQLYNAAQQFKRYRANPTSYGYRAGRVNKILYHPNTSCGTKDVYIKNQATAGLYIYTPYTPNQAALDAGRGTGDSCSAYGNRNFFIYYTLWFGSTSDPTVHSSLSAAYTAQGGAAVVGSPTAEGRYVSANGGGWTQSFTKGELYRTNDGLTTFLATTSPTTTAYKKAGGPTSPWGWPIAGETCTNTTCLTEFRDLRVATINGTLTLGHPFSDVSDNPRSNDHNTHHPGIYWLGEQNITTGWNTPLGPAFKPNDGISRAAAAAFLYRYNKSTYTDSGTPSFTDVPTTHPFYNEIEWMALNGISRTTTYTPSEPISREVMATFLYRMTNPTTYKPPTTSPFTDIPTTHRFYTEISWLHDTGISTGTTTTTGRAYKPKDPLTRAAAATLLHRYNQREPAGVQVPPELDASFVEEGGSPEMGSPTAEGRYVSANGGGWTQSFTKGELYRTNDGLTTFLATTSPTTTAYKKAGGPTSPWGWPIAGETCTNTTCLTEFRDLRVATINGTLTLGHPFSDVSDNPRSNDHNTHHPGIYWLGEQNITTGWNTPLGPAFKPNDGISRAAAAAFLYRYNKSTYTDNGTPSFTDVPTTHPFYNEIEWMALNGISRTTTYTPSEPISREVMATFLYRMTNPTTYKPPTTSPFTDIPTTHRFYTEISWLHDTGISTGTTTTTGRAYKPKDPLTRAAAATLLHRYNQVIGR